MDAMAVRLSLAEPSDSRHNKSAVSGRRRACGARHRMKLWLLSAVNSLAASAALLSAGNALADAPSVERGRYIFDAGGCLACHTDTSTGVPALAGGPPIVTPFGTFYAPNITPDADHGIGRWTAAQFRRALRDGVRPDGAPYYPAFPYTVYAKMADGDVEDLWAYLRTVTPADRPSRPHEISFPISIRLTVLPWKWLNFSPGIWQDDPRRDIQWNRGAYLVEALSHCGECHTPRGWMGSLDRTRWMAGARIGHRQAAAPNLTPGPSGLADWAIGDIVFALETGTTPEGGAFDGEMREVVKYGTSRLTATDRRAIATYLKSLPPLPSAVPPKSP